MRIRFGPFVLDLDTRQLTEEDREIHLSPKAFELLLALVVDRPKVISKTVLQGRLWPETFVAEANLSNLVGEIRGALGIHPERHDSFAPLMGLATPSSRMPPFSTGPRKRLWTSQRAGSSGASAVIQCQSGNTSSAAIPTWR